MAAHSSSPLLAEVDHTCPKHGDSGNAEPHGCILNAKGQLGLLGALDWFPASQWNCNTSSTSRSGRRSSSSSPVAEKRVMPIESASPVRPVLYNPKDEMQKDFGEDPPLRPHEEAGPKGTPGAARSTSFGVSSRPSKLPHKIMLTGRGLVGARASLVCGPLAVQQTLTERQLLIERRMMELRQQNRRRLQRRQREAMEQQQQRLREQHAALLARRQRLKLASLWKERGMAAAARPPALSRADYSVKNANPATTEHTGKDSRRAEELLAALVISESMSLQQADRGSEHSVSSAGLSPGGETTLAPKQENDQLKGLLMQVTQSASIPACTETFYTASSRLVECGGAESSVAATTPASLPLPQLLHQRIQRRRASRDSFPIVHDLQGPLHRRRSVPYLQRLLAVQEANRDGVSETQQFGGLNDPLRGTSSQTVTGPSLLFQTEEGASSMQLMPFLGVQPCGMLAHSMSSGCKGKPKGKTSMVSLPPMTKPWPKPISLLHAPRGQLAAQLEKEESSRHGTQCPVLQPVVLVPNPQLKKQLLLKLRQQQQKHQQPQIVPPSHYDTPQIESTGRDESPLEQQQAQSREKSCFLLHPKERTFVGEDAETDTNEKHETTMEKSSSVVDGRVSLTVVNRESRLPSQQASPSAEKDLVVNEHCETTPNEAAKPHVTRKTPEEVTSKRTASGARRHPPTSTENEGGLAGRISSEGAARAQAAGLQLVRITRQVREDKDSKNGPLDAGGLHAQEGPQSIFIQSPRSRIQGQADNEPRQNQKPADQSSCLVASQFHVAPASMGRQERGKFACCWAMSPRATEDSQCRTSSTCLGPSKCTTGRREQLESIKDNLFQRPKQADSTVRAVRALDEAQHIEEKRLLLLEVSHHAIEKQAKSRRREQAFRQQLQQQYKQSQHISLAGNLQQEQQQDVELSSLPQHLEALSVAAEGKPFHSYSGPLRASTGQSSWFPSLFCRPLQQHLHQQRQQQQQQARQDVQAPIRAASLFPVSSSSVAARRVVAYTHSKPSTFSAASPSSATKKKLEHTTGLVQGHLKRGEPDGRLQQPHQHRGGLLHQQQALLQQLLQQCLSGMSSNPSHGREETGAFASEPHGLMFDHQAGMKTDLLMRNVQRAQIFQALQRLLVQKRATVSRTESILRKTTSQEESKLSPRQQHQGDSQQQNEVQQSPSAVAARARNGAAANAQRQHCSYRSSSSYSRKASMPYLRSEEAQPQQQQQTRQLQQRRVVQSTSRPSSAFKMTSGHNVEDGASALSQELHEQQQLLAAAMLGQLLSRMLQRHPAQQQQHSYRQVEDGTVRKRENINRSNKASTSWIATSEVAHRGPRSLART